MKDHNLTPPQLARGIGGGLRTVYDWLENKCQPTPIAKVAIDIFLAGGEHGEYTRKDWLRYKKNRSCEKASIEIGVPVSTVKNYNNTEAFTKMSQFVLNNRARVL